MDILILYLALGMTVLAISTVLGLIGLRGFTAWIELKRAELDRPGPATPGIGQRIDVADLKERVRRLEAIAAGVDI